MSEFFYDWWKRGDVLPYAGDHVWPLEFYDESSPYDDEDFELQCEGCDGPTALDNDDNRNFCCAFCLDAFECHDAPWELAVTLGDINPRDSIQHTWECQRCGEVVFPAAVTFDEHHDIREGGCGGRCL